MIYNEYAQVLEAKNPDTGAAVHGRRTWTSFDGDRAGTAMLQDAIFASEAWLAKTGNEDIAVRFLRASFRGWIYCRDNVAECVDIVLKSRRAAAEGPPDLADERDQRADLAVARPASASWTRPRTTGRSQIAIEGKVIKAAPTGTAFRNDLAQKALARLGSSRHQGRRRSRSRPSR